MNATMEDANAALRQAVKSRLTSTPADDPKLVGYGRSGEFERFVGEGLLNDGSGSSAFLDVLDRIRHLHRSKSADYGSDVDPLANIRSGAEFVGIEAWRGCMVRICDKMQRLKTFCHTGRLVHEGVEDTLMDLASYAVIALVLFNEERDAAAQ